MPKIHYQGLQSSACFSSLLNMDPHPVIPCLPPSSILLMHSQNTLPYQSFHQTVCNYELNYPPPPSPDPKLHDGKTLTVLFIVEQSHERHSINIWWTNERMTYFGMCRCEGRGGAFPASQARPVRMVGWPIQFSSRQLSLANSYYWAFIMLYWACHKVGEDKAFALRGGCPNLTCHWLASCCS